MSFITWLASKLGKKTVNIDEGCGLDALSDMAAELNVRELAFWSAVNLIAKSISKCEIRTWVQGVEKKGAEYYLWNISPNQNQSSSVFMQKLIAVLFKNNEALIIENQGKLYVADGFERKTYALYENIYSNVTVDDFTFARNFAENEVLYFKPSYKDMRPVTDGIYSSYAKLISYFMQAYQRSKGIKATFHYDALPVAGTPEAESFNSLINEKIKKFLTGDRAAIPLGRGQDLKAFGENKTYSSETTRDVRAMIDDISDFTAKAFGIPPSLIRGDVQDTSEAMNLFLTTCIDPLCDMIQEEIIRKRTGEAEYLKGTRVQIDTKAIKHIDLLSVASSVDKLISSGCFCVNDIRKLCDEPPIEEEWAEKHFITKNYTEVAGMATTEGGEIG